MKYNTLFCFRSKKIMAGVCLAALAAFQTVHGADNRGQLSSSDYKFVVEATEGGQTEVALGQLAGTRASNPAVKQFGERMVQDHTKANQQLTALLTQKGATLPDQTTPPGQKEIDRLQKLTGPDFDKAYMAHMVKDHKKDVKEFQSKADDAKDPDLKSFAASTLPTLEDHLKMAQDIDTTIKAGQ
jgi:putative membrane protein